MLNFDSGTFSPQSIAKMFADISASSVLVDGLSKLSAENLTAITTELSKVADAGFTAALSLKTGFDPLEGLDLGKVLDLASSAYKVSSLDRPISNLSSSLPSRQFKARA